MGEVGDTPEAFERIGFEKQEREKEVQNLEKQIEESVKKVRTNRKTG